MSIIKVMIIHLIAVFIKKTQYICYIKIREYFPMPHERFDRYIGVKLDLPNHATKINLKETAGVYTSNLAAKLNLAGLKAKADKINVYKLRTVPTDLGKL